MSQYECAQTGTATASAGHLTVKSERESIVKEFEWATTELDSIVSELTQRLGPILAPSYDDKVSGMSDPMPEVSPARSQLHNLHAQIARIRWILDRLEV